MVVTASQTFGVEEKELNMADDNAVAAAHLAAALIQAGKLTEKAHGNTVEDATRLYFDCLDAVRAEGKKRYPLTGAGRYF
jgi:hypothetical protein